MSNSNIELMLEHAWKYFEKHSEQRMNIFNFYIVVMGACGAALGLVLQTTKLYPLGIFLGLFIIITSIIFWKLDQRTAFLIKQSEITLKNLEKDFNVKYHIFSRQDIDLEEENKNKNFFTKYRTYGQLFRTIFCFISLLGFLCAMYCLKKIFFPNLF